MRYIFTLIFAASALIVSAPVRPAAAAAESVKTLITVQYCNLWDDPAKDQSHAPGHCFGKSYFTAGILTVSGGKTRKFLRLNRRGRAVTSLAPGRYNVSLSFAGCCVKSIGCLGDGPGMIDSTVSVRNRGSNGTRLVVRAYDRRPV
jgi:hypothetical protein